MKKHTNIGIAVACTVFASVLLGGVGTLKAHDGDWDQSHHYYVDHHGYWDDHDHYGKFIVYKGHHGYWDRRDDKPHFVIVNSW